MVGPVRKYVAKKIEEEKEATRRLLNQEKRKLRSYENKEKKYRKLAQEYRDKNPTKHLHYGVTAYRYSKLKEQSEALVSAYEIQLDAAEQYIGPKYDTYQEKLARKAGKLGKRIKLQVQDLRTPEADKEEIIRSAETIEQTLIDNMNYSLESMEEIQISDEELSEYLRGIDSEALETEKIKNKEINEVKQLIEG